MLNGLPWKWTEIILSFLRLHPSTAFWTLLLTMMATPFLLRDSWVSCTEGTAKTGNTWLQDREGHQGQREAAPRAWEAALLQTHVTSTHCVHCTCILGNSSFDHTSHINLREDSIQALRWARPKTSLRIASAIKLSCSDWNTICSDWI